MDITTAIVTAVGTVLTGFLAFLKTNKGRNQAISYLKRIFNLDLTAEDLRSSLENMSTVVSSQGQSIDWLTQELTNYREQLDDAREKLKQMEDLHQENNTLRGRVTELESQVKSLEDEIARRKKFTPKAKRTDEEPTE